MKLSDIYIVIKVSDNILKVKYVGKYEKCILYKDPNDTTELILKAGQCINLNFQ